MFFEIDRAEAHRRLHSAGCTFLGEPTAGSERWRTRDGYEFWLTPESGGGYEEEMIKRAEALG